MNLETNQDPNPRAMPYGSIHWQRDKHANPHRRSFVTGLNGGPGLGDDWCGAGRTYDPSDGSCNIGGSSGSPSSFDPASLANEISQISQATLPLVISQTPGVVYQRQANGQILVYAQPTGNTQNLPVSASGAAAYPFGTNAALTTPLGSASFGGSMMPIALLAIAAIFLLKK